MKEKFYNKGWFMWLMLIFIAPVGMILMWKNKRFPKAVRTILTVIFCFATILQGIIYFGPKNNINNVSANSNITNSANVAEVSTNNTNTASNNSNNTTSNSTQSNATNNTAALSQNSSSNTTTVQQNSAPVHSTPQPEKKQEPVPTPAPAPKQAATPTPAPPKNISVSASVSDSSPHTNERVTVNVKGPAGGAITAIAHYKSKDTTQNGAISSDGNGAVVFDISRAAKGYAVTIDVDVNSNGQSGHAQTSFTPR